MKSTVLPSVILSVLAPAVVRSAILYGPPDQKTNPAAVFEPNGDCTAAKGCLVANPITVMFTFTLTDAELNLVNTKPGIGTLTVNASRDIGTPNVDVKPPSDDFLNVVSETNQLGSLFRNTQGDCPNPGAGRDTVPGADCGPNYETDSGFKGDNPNAPKGAQDALSISQATFRALAADKTIQLTLTGTDGTGRAGVGRLKVWNVNLRYAEVPEPSTLALSAFALAGLTIARRRRQKPREDASSPYN